MYQLVRPEDLSDEPRLMKSHLLWITLECDSIGDELLREFGRIMVRWPQSDQYGASNLNLFSTEVTSSGLAALRGLKLGTVRFRDLELTPEGVEHIRAVEGLLSLGLTNNSLERGMLQRLLEDSELTQLHVTRNPIAVADLRRVNDSLLQNLMLESCDLNDDHVEVLGDNSRLTHLYLTGNPITDAALDALRPCSTLTMLEVSRTSVTKDGIDRFRQANPGCQIKWDGGTIEPQPENGE